MPVTTECHPNMTTRTVISEGSIGGIAEKVSVEATVGYSPREVRTEHSSVSDLTNAVKSEDSYLVESIETVCTGGSCENGLTRRRVATDNDCEEGKRHVTGFH